MAIKHFVPMFGIRIEQMRQSRFKKKECLEFAFAFPRVTSFETWKVPLTRLCIGSRSLDGMPFMMVPMIFCIGLKPTQCISITGGIKSCSHTGCDGGVKIIETQRLAENMGELLKAVLGQEGKAEEDIVVRKYKNGREMSLVDIQFIT